MSLRKLLAALTVVSMVLGLVGTAAFAQSSADAEVEAAITMLRKFNIVTGERPEDPITRAELMKVLAVAAGQAEAADLLINTTPFSDVQAGQWWTGYIAVAKAKGWTTGFPDGTFRPRENVTYGQVAAFLGRLIGLKEAAGVFPANWTTAFQEAGLVPEGLDLAAKANEPAIRGMVFVLANNAFLKFRDANGKNLYQRVFDAVPPTLTVNPVTTPTTAGKVTVTGTVTDAASVTVNGTAATLAADGSFSAEVELKVGANAINVVAADEVGNTISQTVSVERVNTAAQEIQVAGSLEVEAGQSTTVSYTVKDTNGADIPNAAVEAKVEPAELGTFDVATGTFTAGTKAGTGTLTLTSGEATATVNVTVKPSALAKIEVTADKTSVGKGEEATLVVKGLDQYGNEISALDAEFSVSGTGAYVIGNKFVGTVSGVYTVTAKVGELTGTTTIGVYSSAAGVKLTGPATLVANDKTKAKFTVSVVDEFGNVVTGYSAEDAVTVTLPAELAAEGTNQQNELVLDVENGVATFEVTGKPSAGGVLANIKVTFTDEDGNEWDADADLELVEQVPTAIKVVDQSSKYLRANDNEGEVTISFAVVDQEGERMKDGVIYDLDLVISGPGELEEETVTYYGDSDNADYAVATVKSIADETGTVTVTAKAEGLQSTAATVTAAIAGNPAKVELSVVDDASQSVDDDDPLKVRLTVVDKKGVPVEADIEGTLTVSGKVLSIKYGSNTVNDADELDFNFSGDVAEFEINSTESGTFTVGVKDVTWLNDAGKKVKISGNTVDLTWEPGKATQVGFTRSAVYVLSDTAKVTVTVQAYDKYANETKASGIAVKVFDRDDTGELTINGRKVTQNGVTVRTGEDGKATFEVRTEDLETEYYLELGDKNDGSDVDPKSDASTIKLVVRDRVPAKVTASLRWMDGSEAKPAGTVDAGSTVRLVVKVTDQKGKALDDLEFDPETFLKLEFDDKTFDLDGDGNLETRDEEVKGKGDIWTSGANPGEWYTEGKALKSGTLRLTAKLTAAADEPAASASISVRALAVPDKIAVANAEYDQANDGWVVKVKRGEVTPITLQLVDQYGNLIRSNTAAWPAWVSAVTGDVAMRLTTTGSDLDVDADPTAADTFDIKSTRQVYVYAEDASGGTIVLTAERELDTDGDGTTEKVTITGKIIIQVE